MNDNKIKLLDKFFNELIEDLRNTSEQLYSETLSYNYDKDLKEEINEYKENYKKLKLKLEK